MIILDLSQVMISNLMMNIGNHTNIQLEEDMLRHMILNSIRSINSKHRAQYGELIIACDDKNYWRRDVFPYYKAKRKLQQKESELDWNMIFETLNKIRDELKVFFPYRVIQVDKAEADDIIGTLSHKYGNTDEKILIVSSDKDFRQLQTYMNVRQYDTVRNKWMDENDAEKYLKEHILRGDAGDGVPNFLSDDDVFLNPDKRQRQLRQTRVDACLKQTPEEFCQNETELARYYRNKALVDLGEIPASIQEAIINKYNEESGKDRSKLMNYFIHNRLRNLIERINDF